VSVCICGLPLDIFCSCSLIMLPNYQRSLGIFVQKPQHGCEMSFKSFTENYVIVLQLL